MLELLTMICTLQQKNIVKQIIETAYNESYISEIQRIKVLIQIFEQLYKININH